MKKFGITMTADDAYATEGARGIDTIQRFVKLQQDRDISLDEAQLMYDEKSRIFHSMKEAPVFEGVTDLMRKIKAAGMQIAIVTGSGQRPLITRLINDFYEFVDEAHVVTAYDVERGKPYPDPYLMGLDKCGHLKPWEGIVVENAPLGVKAGAEAQCFTVAVNSGPLPDNTLLNLPFAPGDLRAGENDINLMFNSTNGWLQFDFHRLDTQPWTLPWPAGSLFYLR
jgi:beta-phosphoglucomutase-like phosphatase (HAD superfamily)